MVKGSRIRADGEATRARILETAGRLIAANGFAETTSKAIAAEAEVDLASINYHFESRNGLYLAVLAEAHRRLVSLADLTALAESDLCASERLEGMLASMVARSQQRDDWNMRVLARELVSPSSHLQMLFSSELEPKLAIIKNIVSEISGIPADNPALLRCLVSVAAPCLMLLVVGQNIPGPVQAVLHMPGEVLINHLHTFSVAGLAAIGKQHREVRG